jgi:uncharacterized membrane protein
MALGGLGLHNNFMQNNRLVSVDWLRGLAMIFMIQAHVVFFLSPWYPALRLGELTTNSLIYNWVDLDTYAAPAFVFLVGFSLFLWRQKNNSLTPWQQQSTVFKRGALIFLLGFFVSWVMRGHFMINDILNVIGFSLMLCAIMWRLPLLIFLAVGLLLLTLAPMLQQWSGYLLLDHYNLVWPGVDDGVWSWSEVFVNYVIRGNQGLIPWVSFSLLGWCAAYVWFKSKWSLAALAIFLYVAYYLIEQSFFAGPYVAIFAYYPATTVFMFKSLSLILALLLLFNLVARLQIKSLSFMSRFLTLYSRFSLSVYVVHLILCLGLLRWAGIIGYNDDTYYTETLLTFEQALWLSWVFMGLVGVGLHYWDRYNGGKYSLKWGLGQLTRP